MPRFDRHKAGRLLDLRYGYCPDCEFSKTCEQSKDNLVTCYLEDLEGVNSETVSLCRHALRRAARKIKHGTHDSALPKDKPHKGAVLIDNFDDD